MPKNVPRINIANAPFAMAPSPPNFHLMARIMLTAGIPMGVIIANIIEPAANIRTQDIAITQKLWKNDNIIPAQKLPFEVA